MFFKKRASPTKIQFGGNGTGKHMLCFSVDEKAYNCLKSFCQKHQKQVPYLMVIDNASTKQKAVTLEKSLYDAYLADQKELE